MTQTATDRHPPTGRINAMDPTYDTSHLDDHNRSEFERFLAIVNSTPYTPYPEADVPRRRQASAAMANMNEAEGVMPGPLSHLLAEVGFQQRIPTDDIIAMHIRWVKEREQ